MKIGELDVSKIYLGSAEIEKIYLGTEQVYGGDTPTPPTPVPSTDVPLDNNFAVKVNGEWHESMEHISTNGGIENYLYEIGIDPSLVEELAIGNNTTYITLNCEIWFSCTGLTLAQSVTETYDVHNFPAMQWVNVMASNLVYMGSSGLFSDMNCCPIYVPEDYLSDYQSNWGGESTEDCDGSVSDRLVAWTPYIDPNN